MRYKGGMQRLAVILCMATGCWTGKSRGVVPFKIRSIKPVVKDIVQPVKAERVTAADPDGEEGGVVGGVVGGPVDGVVGAPPPPPPPPPPARPFNVPPTVLEQNRIAGDKRIAPDAATAAATIADGKDKVVASLQLCVGADGAVTQATLLKSSGYPAYDAQLAAGMHAWKYRPYYVNGNTVPVCTAVTFIWSR